MHLGSRIGLGTAPLGSMEDGPLWWGPQDRPTAVGDGPGRPRRRHHVGRHRAVLRMGSRRGDRRRGRARPPGRGHDPDQVRHGPAPRRLVGRGRVAGGDPGGPRSQPGPPRHGPGRRAPAARPGPRRGGRGVGRRDGRAGGRGQGPPRRPLQPRRRPAGAGRRHRADRRRPAPVVDPPPPRRRPTRPGDGPRTTTPASSVGRPWRPGSWSTASIPRPPRPATSGDGCRGRPATAPGGWPRSGPRPRRPAGPFATTRWRGRRRRPTPSSAPARRPRHGRSPCRRPDRRRARRSISARRGCCRRTRTRPPSPSADPPGAARSRCRSDRGGRRRALRASRTPAPPPSTPAPRAP